MRACWVAWVEGVEEAGGRIRTGPEVKGVHVFQYGAPSGAVAARLCFEDQEELLVLFLPVLDAALHWDEGPVDDCVWWRSAWRRSAHFDD